MENELNWLDWVVLGIFMFVNFGIALFVVFKVKSLRDFSVAGGKMGTAAVFATMAASFFGPGYSMGFAGKGYQVGLIFVPIFAAFGLKTMFEGLALGPRLRRYDGAATLGDIVGFHYGKSARFLTGVLSVLFCAGIAGVVCRAAGVMLHSFSGVSVAVAAAVCAGVVVVYSALGGMWSSIQSDIFQFIVITLLVPLVPIMLLFGIGLGSQEAVVVSQQLDGDIWGSLPALSFVGLFLSFLLGETLAPAYTQRIFVGRSSENTKKGFALAGLLFIPWAFMLLSTGVLLRSVVPGVKPDSVLINGIVKLMPMGMKGLCCAALCSIIMSTMDSFLNSGATSFTYDLYVPFVRPKASERESLIAARLATAFIGLFGLVLAITFPSLIDALLQIYTLWAPTVVLPVILAAYGVRTNPFSGLASIVAGGIVAAIWAWFLKEPFGLPAVIPGLVANQIAFWVVHFAFPYENKGNLIAVDGSNVSIKNY